MWRQRCGVSQLVLRQLTICFKPSKPVQIGLCMLMPLNIHLHSLHLDAQYGQTWQLSTKSRRSGEDWSLASVVNHTIATDLTSQVSISLVIHTRLLVNHFRTGHGQCRANLHKWGLAQSSSSDCGQWQTVNHMIINKVWGWTESTPQSGWWRSHMAGIYSDCSTRKIINTVSTAVTCWDVKTSSTSAVTTVRDTLASVPPTS